MNTENNKIIAKFMGLNARLVSPDFYSISKDNVHITGHKPDVVMFGFCESAKYQKDWNWLMGVVEKIENTSFKDDNFFNVTIGCGFDCTIQDAHGKLIEISTCEHTKIETVYNACVEFIKWYNLQTNAI